MSGEEPGRDMGSGLDRGEDVGAVLRQERARAQWTVVCFGCAGSPLLAWVRSLQQAGPVLCSAQAPRCGGFSPCRAQGRGLEDSVVVTHRLSCSQARGIFPDQGLNRIPCTGWWILTHRATKEVPGINSVCFDCLNEAICTQSVCPL